MENIENNAQWFIITAIGGKEASIIETLKEKIHNFNYDSYVGTIRVFKDKILTEDTFSKDDPTLPKSLKNTKTTTWESLPNGKYKRIRSKIVNKFPGYVFINMIMNTEVWYAIRNTPGVLGFVGSSGKGALPIPISIEEYNKVDKTINPKPIEEQQVEDTSTATLESPVIHVTNVKVGNTIDIINGGLTGMSGIVKSIDNTKGTINVEVDMFGRMTNVELGFADIKLAE